MRKGAGPRLRGGSQAAAFAAGLALTVDRIGGEPPTRVHPVAAFGRVMEAWERRIWSDSRPRGILYAVSGAGAGILAGRALEVVPMVGTIVAGYSSMAGRALFDAAGEVRDALRLGDLERAREGLPALVGRDPSVLDAKGIAAAAVESVAENCVDAVIAPIFWTVVAGAPGALGYRAINTMDAMVGYRSERYRSFGWAAARLDDATGWLPARWTAGLVRRERPAARADIDHVLSRQASRHPSPNAGVAEGAFAAALGLRLGGVTVYPDRVEQRPELGLGRSAEWPDIDEAIALADAVARRAVREALALSVAQAIVNRSVRRVRSARSGHGGRIPGSRQRSSAPVERNGA